MENWNVGMQKNYPGVNALIVLNGFELQCEGIEFTWSFRNG